jgi:ABC-type xylose transport system permease subunit
MSESLVLLQGTKDPNTAAAVGDGTGLLGGLIVGVIYNGLQLLGLGAAAQQIWTAGVLIAAAMIDVFARRGSQAR